MGERSPTVAKGGRGSTVAGRRWQEQEIEVGYTRTRWNSMMAAEGKRRGTGACGRADTNAGAAKRFCPVEEV